MTHLVVSNLSKSYGAARIIKGIGFALEQGEFLALLGPSGSGKTTILRCIAGLEVADEGPSRISLGTEMLTKGARQTPPERRAMGMVFQNYAVWPHMSVFQNVAFPLTIKGRRSTAEVAKAVRETLSLVKLSSYESRFPHELSGGQQQRVALARALVDRPKLLLLDEPLSNLDALLRDELGTEIRRLQKELGLTTILVTHDQKEALSLADRVIVLDKGEIAADGPPEVLYDAPPTAFVAEFLSGAQRVAVPLIGERLLLPRRWLIADDADVGNDAWCCTVRIVTRIFRGSEYEYLATVSGVSEPLRFFSTRRLEADAPMALAYRAADMLAP